MGTMFEHLDDPTEIAPGAAAMAAVSRRAEAIRIRRRWVLMIGSCCTLLAASVAFFLSRPESSQTPSSTASYQFNLEKGPLNVGSPVPNTALVDVQFASAQDGYALAIHRNELLLAVSSDGGATWQVRNDQLPAKVESNPNAAGQLEFVGFTGYLWGASTASGAPLWISHDQGASWKEAPIGPYVLDASAIGLNVWALTGTCPGQPSTNVSSCSIELEQSLDGGETWTALVPPTVPITVSGSFVPRQSELARITRTRAYVLTNEAGSAETFPGWNLEFTDDGGASWTSRSAPCEGAFADGAEVAASSTDDLWLLCGSQASAGSQSKELFRSKNGGRSWSLTTSATGVGTLGPRTVLPNSLPLMGYVAPFTVGHHNLSVLSSTEAWLFPTRAGLYATTDGGSGWSSVTDLADAGFGNGGGGNVTFLSPTDGWICEYGVGLWHTTDGLQWLPLGAK
jgi:hypothetical protein